MWKKTALRRVGAAKSKRKAIKFGNKPWASIQKRKGDLKIGEQIKKSIYNWIIHHQQVVQSPIANDCLKVKMMVTLNRNWFQNCYCICLSDNFITILLETQYMVDSKKQEMNIIISLSVILHYVHYCYPNF